MNRCRAVGCDREVAAKNPSEIWKVPTNTRRFEKRTSLLKHFESFESIWLVEILVKKIHQHELIRDLFGFATTQPNQQHPTKPFVGPSLDRRNAQENQPAPWTRKTTQPRVFPRSLNLAICQFAGIFMCSKLMLLSPVNTLLTTTPKLNNPKCSKIRHHSRPGMQFLVMVNLQLFIVSVLGFQKKNFDIQKRL